MQRRRGGRAGSARGAALIRGQALRSCGVSSQTALRGEGGDMPTQNVSELSMQELSKYFKMPEKAVAKHLGICLTSLKKICRANGINRWPYRKVRAAQWRRARRACTRTRAGENRARTVPCLTQGVRALARAQRNQYTPRTSRVMCSRLHRGRSRALGQGEGAAPPPRPAARKAKELTNGRCARCRLRAWTRSCASWTQR